MASSMLNEAAMLSTDRKVKQNLSSLKYSPRHAEAIQHVEESAREPNRSSPSAARRAKLRLVGVCDSKFSHPLCLVTCSEPLQSQALVVWAFGYPGLGQGRSIGPSH